MRPASPRPRRVPGLALHQRSTEIAERMVGQHGSDLGPQSPRRIEIPAMQCVPCLGDGDVKIIIWHASLLLSMCVRLVPRASGPRLRRAPVTPNIQPAKPEVVMFDLVLTNAGAVPGGGWRQ